MLPFLIAGLLASAAVDSVVPLPITQLVHGRWTRKDGAPIGVRSLAQTSDGYIWLGTSSGLVRFDGVRFVPFAPRGRDTLPTQQAIQRLMATRDGSLWIVWRQGAVSRMRDGRLTTYGENDGLATAFQLAEARDGSLVAGTLKGLAHFVDGRWSDVSRAWNFPGTESRAVWFDRDDVLWATTHDRMVYRPNGASEFLDPKLPRMTFTFRADFHQERDGTIWMSEVNRSAHTLRKVGEESMPLTEVMVTASALLIDRSGSLWVTTAGDGLRRVPDPRRIRGRAVPRFGAEAEQFTMKQGLLSDDPEALLEDREGNVWVGSEKGLESFRAGDVTPFSAIGSNTSRIVFTSRDTTLWTAAYLVPGVQRIGPRGQDTLPSTFGVYSLAEDASGVVWTANRTNVMRLQGREFTPVKLRSHNARALTYVAIDPSGTVWVLDNDQGLFRLANDSLVHVASLPEPVIRRNRLYSDRAGRIWVGQFNRAAVYDRGKLTLFGTAEGVRPGIVYDFFEDRSGVIWSASTTGLSRYDGKGFRTVGERQGIPGGAVYGLAQDSAGAWWLATRMGVVRVPAGEAERAAMDTTYSVRSRLFDIRDGVPGPMPQGYWGPILSLAADGRIWVAADSGVAVIDPRRLGAIDPPHVLIESARLDGRDMMPAAVLTILPGRHDLEIDYTATDFAFADRIRFRYVLEGADDDWHDVGTRRRAYYNGLPPGTYRFRVAASSGNGVWSEVRAAQAFRVLPAWYQTVWSRVALVLLVATAGAGAAALVQRRRHLRLQGMLEGRYEATMAERGRIAQDLHDTLLQGFIGVTLQLKAAERALPHRPDVASETIRGVQRLARESLREARERVWDMHQAEAASQDLPAALATIAHERVVGTGIEIATSVIGERRRLDREIEDTAFRIGREAVANAIRHANAHRISIVVTYDEASLKLAVSDDGRGFAPEEGEAARVAGHFGLSGIRARAARHGGHCDVYALPAGGTMVNLELPLA